MAALRRTNMDGDLDNPIACGLRSHVFRTISALTDHLQFHALLDRSARQQQLLINHMSDPPEPGWENARLSWRLSSNGSYVPIIRFAIERNPFSIGASSARNSDRQPNIVRPQTDDISVPTPTLPTPTIPVTPVPVTALVPLPVPTPQTPSPPISVTPSRVADFVPQVVTRPWNNSHFTRPFLQLLESRLLIEGMSTIADRHFEAELGDQEMLDLTLRL